MPQKTAKKSAPKETSSSKAIPSVDKDAALEIEKIIKSSDVPAVDRNAPLKIDGVAEKEENEPQEKSNHKLFVFGGISLGVIIVAVVGLFICLSMQSGQEKPKEAKVEPSPAAVTVKQTLIKSEWSFEVLNGSGVAGAAKNVADQLTSLGYRVVETGNADKQTYKGNGLFVSKNMRGKADLVVADLKGTLEIATIAGILRNSTASARIIVGR
jgi:hypothetical protein